MPGTVPLISPVATRQSTAAPAKGFLCVVGIRVITRYRTLKHMVYFILPSSHFTDEETGAGSVDWHVTHLSDAPWGWSGPQTSCQTAGPWSLRRSRAPQGPLDHHNSSIFVY